MYPFAFAGTVTRVIIFYTLVPAVPQTAGTKSPLSGIVRHTRFLLFLTLLVTFPKTFWTPFSAAVLADKFIE